MGLKQRSNLLVRKVGDELVVLDQIANQVHQLNAVASLVWELCDGSSSVSTMVAQVKERYDVESDAAERDVQNLLAQFTELGLLVMDHPRNNML